MKKNCTIRFRLDSELKQKVGKAILKYNSAEGLANTNLAEFIRTALREHANRILASKKVTISFEQ